MFCIEMIVFHLRRRHKGDTKLIEHGTKYKELYSYTFQSHIVPLNTILFKYIIESSLRYCTVVQQLAF